MKKVLLSLFMCLFGVSAKANDPCEAKAEKAAKALMSLNNVVPVMAELTLKKHVQDEVNTDYYVYQFVPLDSQGDVLDFGYEISVSTTSCKVIAFESKGGN